MDLGHRKLKYCELKQLHPYQKHNCEQREYVGHKLPIPFYECRLVDYMKVGYRSDCFVLEMFLPMRCYSRKRLAGFQKFQSGARFKLTYCFSKVTALV